MCFLWQLGSSVLICCRRTAGLCCKAKQYTFYCVTHCEGVQHRVPKFIHLVDSKARAVENLLHISCMTQ